MRLSSRFENNLKRLFLRLRHNYLDSYTFISTMADEEEEEPQHIYDARVEKMVVSLNDGKTKWRIARFLFPLAENVKEAVFIPHTTLLLADVLPHTFHPPNVVSKGWNSPQQKWKQWVLQLAPKYQLIWIQAGIRDAIFSSTYELRFNQEIVLGLAEFWCRHTNTFVFPWGEATVTLEDVMILGGYPLLGELVTSPLTEDLEMIVGKMEKFRAGLLKSKSKKADHAGWLKQFIEEEDSEIAHVAFLSLWLSRYVFPSRVKDLLESNVFPIAAKLSRGVKVALGPAVLANVYSKLREFTRASMKSLMEESVIVPGNFQMLQAWAFERFPALVTGLKSPNILATGDPRMARWHKVIFKLNMPLVRSALRLAENFEWRPYAADLVNWHHRSFYKESEQLVFDCLSLDEELQSYVRSLRVSQLVGTDGRKEKYLPNRVAMQFGMDQDLPGDVLNFKCTSEIVSVFVPSRSFQPGVSLRYWNWWKDSMISREGAIKDALSKKDSLRDLKTSVIQDTGSEDEYDTKSDSSDVDEDIMNASLSRAQKVCKRNNSPKFAVQKKQKNKNIPEVPAGLRNVRNPKSSSEVSKNAADGKSHNPITKSRLNVKIKKDVYEDSSGDKDLLPISNRFRKEAAGVKNRSRDVNTELDSSSSCDHQREENEKLSAMKKENSQEKVTFESVSPVANEVQAKTAGGSMNPINIDDDSDKSGDDDYCSTSSKRRKDIEGRIQRLEKMLGVSQVETVKKGTTSILK